LHLFSDGVFEVVDRAGRELGLEDIVAMLPGVTGTASPMPDDPKRLYDRIRAIARPGQLDDDFSALVFRFP
jgi:serine phosphatase RsbU (regulator of sigma subunit)